MILWKKKEICNPDQMEVRAKILNNLSLERQMEVKWKQGGRAF